MKIFDKQKFSKNEGLGRILPNYIECTSCGKFNKPSNRKRLSYSDKYCRNCGVKYDG